MISAALALLLAADGGSTEPPVPPALFVDSARLFMGDGGIALEHGGCWLPASRCVLVGQQLAQAHRDRDELERLRAEPPPSPPIVLIGALVLGAFALGVVTGAIFR